MGKGIRLANEAVNILHRIPDDDPHIRGAVVTLMQWANRSL